LERILLDALRVLEKIGVECTHEGARRRLTDREGISIAGDRVRFSVTRVQGFLTTLRSLSDGSPAKDDTPFSLEGCWAGLNYCDPETLEIRPASSAEAADMARLWDARGLSGVVPLVPGDVPPALVTLAAERIALTNSRYLGGALTVTDPREIQFLMDMNLVVGRRYQLIVQVGISPLKLNAKGLETALQFNDHPDVDVKLAGFIPMAGATCPLDPRAALIQSVAEYLAFEMVCSALGIASKNSELRVEPFDLQYSSIVFGSPEWCLYRATALQMAEFLTGRPERSGRFRSVAKRPNAQAACERTASVLWQALLGVRRYGGVGQLSIDEVFSPQQAVLDGEILGYVERVIKGLDLEPCSRDPVALILEGVQEEGFFGVPDTVTRFRDFYHFPDIFRHWNLGTWRAEGEPSILSEAWARAKEEISTSTYQVSDDQHKEINEIYERARKRFSA
jgi:trimethylamine:corrinoid methyltransferase-like protein